MTLKGGWTWISRIDWQSHPNLAKDDRCVYFVTFKAAKMPKGVKAKSYQISYRQNGKTRTVTVSAKNHKTFKVTVKNLTKSRKYTFEVRAVAKIGGKTRYSAWSSYSKGIRAK